MAWRPAEYLIEGELEDTQRGRVLGWMEFTGLAERVSFDLAGKFNRDIRATRIHLYGDADIMVDQQETRNYMSNFAIHQTGHVGDITAGLSPLGYVEYPYIEWYSSENGRIVIERDSYSSNCSVWKNEAASLRKRAR